MKKTFLLIAFIVVTTFQLQAQTAPFVTNQKSYGGSSNDQGTSIKRTPDKGFIVAANTSSATMPGFHGYQDYLVKKFDKKGKVQWSKCYGGSDFEYVSDIALTQDGGYIIVGNSS